MSATTPTNLVARYGEPVTLRRRAPGVAPADTAANAIVLTVTASQADGVTVLLGSRFFRLAAAGLGVVPDAKEWSVVHGGLERRVTMVRERRRSGTVLSYDLFTRA